MTTTLTPDAIASAYTRLPSSELRAIAKSAARSQVPVGQMQRLIAALVLDARKQRRARPIPAARVTWCVPCREADGVFALRPADLAYLCPTCGDSVCPGRSRLPGGRVIGVCLFGTDHDGPCEFEWVAD